MAAVIETHELTKIYEGAFRGQDVHALKDLNMVIDAGEIFAYLGPNGSGKTTTIKMLLGLIFPTSGTIQILGSDDIASSEIRRQIGFLPEGAYYPDFLRGEEVLKFYGQLYGLGGRDLGMRIDRALEIVGMIRARKRMIRGYSKGMRQRIGLAQALLSDPSILILDEPTTGLDPIARKEIRDILGNLRDEGKTLMISSHELLEVEMISDRVSILFEGEVQVSGTISELLTDRDFSIEVLGASASALAAVAEKGIESEDHVGEKTLLRVPSHLALYDAIDVCKSHNFEVVGIAPRRETLEELFVRTVQDAEDRARAGAPAPADKVADEEAATVE